MTNYTKKRQYELIKKRAFAVHTFEQDEAGEWIRGFSMSGLGLIRAVKEMMKFQEKGGANIRSVVVAYIDPYGWDSRELREQYKEDLPDSRNLKDWEYFIKKYSVVKEFEESDSNLWW